MGLCPTMEPSTPFVQRPSFAGRINQLPARKNWPWIPDPARDLPAVRTLSLYLTKIAGRLGGYLARAKDPPPGNIVRHVARPVPS